MYLNSLIVKEQFNAIYSAKEVFNNSCCYETDGFQYYKISHKL